MIEVVFYLFKMALVVVGIALVYASSRGGKSHYLYSGVSVFFVALMMTGAEMMSDSESPWTYLLLSGTEQDWSRAFFGGTLLVMLPFLMMAFCGKDLARLLDGKE